MVKKIDVRGKTVLVIPDLHCPYHHKKLFQFLRYLKLKYKPDVVIFLGDEVDGHAWSFHGKDPALPNPCREMELAINAIRGINRIFPEAYLLDSNHGSLLERKVKFNGLPMQMLKPLKQLYGTPKWSWHNRIQLKTLMGDVMLGHGVSGKPGGWATPIGMSTIEGHFHTKFHLTWFVNALRKYFSIHSGCLIDYKAYAFAYAHPNIPEPMLGATILHSTGHPELIPLEGIKL